MAVLDLCYYGNPILATNSEKIKEINDEIRQFCENLVESMKFYDGLGLAANQVGKAYRIFAIDLSFVDENNGIEVFINPVILDEEGTQYESEGCLSFPGIFEKVKRPAKLKLKYTNLNGETKTIEADDLLARAISHENDHVHGVVFIDRMSKFKRRLLKRKLKKIMELNEK